MKTYAKLVGAKEAGPTLTPDGKALLGAGRRCGKSCRNRDDGRAFCQNSSHAAEYREIAELRAEFRSEQLRQDMTALLVGPERAELTHFGYSLTKNMAEAEELIQQACYNAFRHAATYDSSRSLNAWLKTILRNAFYDSRRHSSRSLLSLDFQADEDEYTLGDSMADSGALIETRLIEEGGCAALLDAISTLPRGARRAVTLCDIEGLTYKAAARRLGLPVDNFRSRIFRARRILRKKIKRAS